MDFSEVIGQTHIKAHLQKSLETGRIPHAQLFSGSIGSGLFPMALAYASEILTRGLDPSSEAFRIAKQQVRQLVHPDLHFVFPVNTTSEITVDKPISDDFIALWRPFILNNPYASVFQWLNHLGIEKKQPIIREREANSIAQKLKLKSFKGGFKVMIIWMAETMNPDCGNKILKLIEEPEDKTVLIFLAEREEKLLITIQSRLQKIEFPLLAASDIAEELVRNHSVDNTIAHSIAARARGDFNRALLLLSETSEEKGFEKLFIQWVRTAFRAKGDKTAINELLKWSDILAAENRETQKKFLFYCSETFRQALMENYNAKELVYFQADDKSFSIERFAPYVHQNNIVSIFKSLEDAIYHIERNANAKVLFTDLSIRLTRYIHAPK